MLKNLLGPVMLKNLLGPVTRVKTKKKKKRRLTFFQPCLLTPALGVLRG
jgi:hypothetical protein